MLLQNKSFCMTFKRTLIAVFVFLILLAGAGIWFGRPAYHQWKEQRFLAQGRAFLAKSEFANAWLSGVQALSLNASNVQTYRFLAELADQAKFPQSIYLRRKIVDLEPGALTNRLAWAWSALNVESFPFPLAVEALESVNEAGRQTVDYRFVAAALALRRNDYRAAEFHFAEAAKLAPANEAVQLNLASLRLRSSDSKVVETAQVKLEELLDRPTVKPMALRSLAAFFLENKKFDQAEKHSQELQAQSGAEFADKLLHLTVLFEAKKAELAGYLSSLQTEAPKSPGKIYELSSWMIRNGLADSALTWLEGQSQEVRSQYPVPLAIAETYFVKTNWNGLEKLLRKQDWAGHDFQRLALVARAQESLGETEAADVHWRKALRLASDQHENLSMLAQMASSWGWQTKVEEVLWLIANKFPSRRWALQSLYEMYLARGNTAKMKEVYAAIVKLDPKDLVAKNNLAVVSFLLNTDLETAHTLARDIHQAEPKNAAFASTYAFSLHLQGKTQEGLGILRGLSEQDLQNPSVALYYGALLRAAGETERARKYLVLAQNASLLPEEKTLLSEAK